MKPPDWMRAGGAIKAFGHDGLSIDGSILAATVEWPAAQDASLQSMRKPLSRNEQRRLNARHYRQ